MAWESARWWLREVARLNVEARPLDVEGPPSHAERPSPRAAPGFVRFEHITPPRVDRVESAQRLVDSFVEELGAALQCGGGGDALDTRSGRALLGARAPLRGALVVSLVQAIQAWPRGAEASRLHMGPRVLGRVIESLLSGGATMTEQELTQVVRGLAHTRPPVARLEGLVPVAEELVHRHPDRVCAREAVEVLRHALPLEARGLRHRLQLLLVELERRGRGA